ncbi:ABC transporter permease [Brevundimonas faecalis]|uniref:ABC transporter permease n=1 Tax=Brevundimonas faecalis TaxID=947378 RepID=UPI00361BCCB8
MSRPFPLKPALTLPLLVGLACLAVMIFGDRLSGYDHRAIDLSARLVAPLSHGHLIGTDELGRDVLARLLNGLRWSVGAAFCATLIAFCIGTSFGLVAAHRGAALGAALKLLTTFTQSFPSFVMAVTVIALLGDSGFWAVTLTLGLVTWPVFSRVVYAEARSLFQREYVQAAEMTGMSVMRLYARHVLPALVPTLSVLVVFHFAEMIVAEGALSFLGIGAPLGAATWGAMLSEGRAFMLEAPWLTLGPAFAMVIIIVSAHSLGKQLRDAAR